MARLNWFPEIISITLYKYNSIDSKLYTLIKNQSIYQTHRGTILVRAHFVQDLLKEYFKEELEKLAIVSNRTLHRDANSIYFLNKIFTEMKNLRWYQISLSKNAAYTRIETGEELKTLNFAYKVVRGTFRTFDFFKKEEITYVNEVLKKIGCIKKTKYSIVKLDSLANRLEGVLVSSNDQNYKNVCQRLLTYFDSYIEDNPEALIVTDYLDI